MSALDDFKARGQKVARVEAGLEALQENTELNPIISEGLASPRVLTKDTKQLSLIPGNIPPMLKRFDRWSPWKAVWSEKRGKFDKIPQLASNPDYGLSTAKPDKWVSFDKALEAFAPDKSTGLGFVTTGVVGVVAIDLDKCFGADWALDIITKMGSYTEISPSGNGYRIFVKGGTVKDVQNHKVGIEIYGGNERRYVTVTGHHVEGTPADLVEVDAALLAELVEKYDVSKDSAKVVITDMPEILDEMFLPSTDKLTLHDGPKQFLINGGDGGDGSGALFGAAMGLVNAGYPDDEVFSILAINTFAMEVATRHRGGDEGRALEYLWKHHCLKARSQCKSSIASVDEFDVVELEPGAVDLPIFDRNKDGSIKPDKTNVVAALRRSDITGQQFRLDTFKAEIMIAPANTDQWRAFKDTDYTAICLKLESGARGFGDIKKDRIRESVAYVAERNSFDSAAFWLNSLVWDGVQRLDTFIPRYFGAKDEPYTRAIGLYLWTALAGRLIEPGIKADMVPVAVGAQGAMKSSSVAAIAPDPDFFLEVDIADDDIHRLIRGKLVIELGELKGLRRKDLDHVKTVITRRYEEWTPKFMEMNTRYPRRCLFFGTTNQAEFLEDDTGNRRWLPFDVGVCDPQGIADIRGQLWAEGRELFQSKGIQWQDAERLAKEVHDAYVVRDGWEEPVRDWLWCLDFDGARPADGPVTSVSALLGAVQMKPANMNQQHKIRMTKVLKTLGGEEYKPYVNGKQTRAYCFADSQKSGEK